MGLRKRKRIRVGEKEGERQWERERERSRWKRFRITNPKGKIEEEMRVFENVAENRNGKMLQTGRSGYPFFYTYGTGPNLKFQRPGPPRSVSLFKN